MTLLCSWLRVLRRVRRRHALLYVSWLMLYLITFGWGLKVLCNQWPYSKYFHGNGNDNEIVKRVHAQNEKRAQQAKQYISQLNTAENNKYYSYNNDDDTDIVIGIITMKREKESKHVMDYLTQTMAATDQSIKADQTFDKKILFLCNIDANPAGHTEAQNLSQFFPMYTPYSNSNLKPSPDRFEKEKRDYTYCLIKALSYSPKYVILLEDDAQPLSFFLPSLHTLLHHRLEAEDTPGHSHHQAWFMVKLYYPEKWSGYGNEWDKILELVGFGLLGASVCYFLTKQPLSVILGCVYFILLAYSVGRQYFVHLRRTSLSLHRLVPAPGCCTQAVMYNAASARLAAHELSLMKCSLGYAVDLAIDSVAGRLSGTKSFLVEPNLIRHIGFVSSLRANVKKAAEFLE